LECVNPRSAAGKFFFFRSDSCGGGYMPEAFRFAFTSYLAKREDYPYKGLGFSECRMEMDQLYPSSVSLIKKIFNWIVRGYRTFKTIKPPIVKDIASHPIEVDELENGPLLAGRKKPSSKNVIGFSYIEEL
jgi:hypothetical protein